jgi:hypothetical protein
MPGGVGVAAKIERARHHASELETLAEDWLENGPKAVLHIDVDGDWEVGVVEVPPVPPIIPIILGEIVHNLRSALDNLIYDLVLALGMKPGVHNYFPVAYDEAGFKALVLTKRDRRNRLRKGCLDPIPPSHDAFKIIRKHQPYNGRDSFYKPGTPASVPFAAEIEWLALIQRMWNTDKHRMLLRATYICPETEEEVLSLFDWHANATLLEHKVNQAVLNQSLEDHHEVARFRFSRGAGSQPSLHPKAEFPSQIMLGSQPDGRMGVRFGHGVPYQLVRRVNSIFEDLRRFL